MDQEEIDGSQGPIGHCYALGSKAAPNSMRVSGIPSGKKVEVLIDTGSNHNFVREDLVSKLKFKPHEHPKFDVMVEDGSHLKCAHLCTDVELNLQGSHFKLDLFILPMHGVDVVLGMCWLRSLGSIMWNFTSMEMTFAKAGKPTSLKANDALEGELVDSQEALKKFWATHMAFICLAQPLTSKGELKLEEQVPSKMNDLLKSFQDVFGEPKGLPHSRSQDHHIPLVKGQGPISVRPYRYAFAQKGEIEKLVQEMLESSIIRPSSSAYSSPVLLVRKKDNSWRFCIDYRALNEVTYKDKHSIPVINELLDELYGAKYFSKLDLRTGYHQIRMVNGDIHKTAFRTHDGHYEFLVMPFGLTNAPPTFQRTMNNIFRHLLRKFVLVFFDDILVYSASWEDHLKHVGIVLKF